MSGVMGGSAERPLPTLFEWDEGFWEAAKERRLVVQACTDCETVRSFPRMMCPKCHSMKFHWVDASGKATLYSWSTLYRSFHPAFADLPITVVIVELDDYPDVHLISSLKLPDGMTEDDLRIGQPLEVSFTSAGEGMQLPEFRLVETP